MFCLGSRTVDPRWCRGCSKWAPAANFTYGSNGLENDCYYIFQCVWRICKGQDKLDWLASVRGDDNKLKAVIDHYRAHRSAVSTANKQKQMNMIGNNRRTTGQVAVGWGGRRKKPKANHKGSSTWSVASCMEYVRAITEVSAQDEGELMCCRRFCEWVTDRLMCSVYVLCEFSGSSCV